MGDSFTHEFSMGGVNTGRMTPPMQTTVNMPDSPDLPGSGGSQQVTIPGQPIMRPSFLQAFLANLGPALAGGLAPAPGRPEGAGIGGAIANIQSVGNQNRQYSLQVDAARRAQEQQASTLNLQAEQLKQLQQMGPLEIQQKKQALDLQRAQLAFYGDPTNLDRVAAEATQSLGPLNPNEQAQINAAKAQARIDRKIDPISAAVKDISDGRRTDARAEQTVEKQELADFVKNPPKGYKGTPTEFLRYKSSITPVLNFKLSNTGTTGPVNDVASRFGYTPAAFDAAAEKYFQTGQLPPSGRGGPALAANKAIMNRATELHPGESLAASSASYAANKESLKKLQGNLDAVSAFENTANKNLDLFLQQGQKIIDSGSPLINRPLRTIGKDVIGSGDQAAWDAARQVAVNEIAKVTSSPGLSGQLSDTARKEIESFIPQNATFAQTYRVAQVLRQDMANRHQAYNEQIADIKSRMGTNAPTEKPKANRPPLSSFEQK